LLGGYTGSILRVELTRNKILKESLPEELVRKFIGGPGISTKILYDEVPHWVEAFDPLNLLIFSTGPLTGTAVPSTGRHFVNTKSPLTGYLGEANAGGFWGAELKFAGYDLIVVSGRAAKPVYLYVDNDRVEIRDAKPYWGMDAREADRAIHEDIGDKKVKIVDIGQAGENLVLISGIMGEDASRAAARCGVGAVMGSKNLKAIAVKGDRKVPVADRESLQNCLKELANILSKDPNTRSFRKYGTAGYYSVGMDLGDSPVRNWTRGVFKGADKISLPGGYESVYVGNRACFNCMIACRRVVEVNRGRFATAPEVEGLEYQSLAALGGNCCIDDIEALVKANDLCNLYGLDTISTGSVIAFAMECYEKGIIDENDTDGIDLKFGNKCALIKLIHRIAKREGIGDLLSCGVARASQILGKETFDLAIHVKRLEVAMHDPRAFQALSLTYACSPTGARHMEGETVFAERPAIDYPELELSDLDRLSTKRKAEAAFKVQNLWSALSASGYCLLACATGTTAYPINLNVQFLKAVTGRKLGFKGLMKVGERIFNLRRAFSMKHGLRREEDTLPRRLLEEPLKEGGSKGSTAKLTEMIGDYYRIRGWNPMTGIPTKDKLAELELDDVAASFY